MIRHWVSEDEDKIRFIEMDGVKYIEYEWIVKQWKKMEKILEGKNKETK